MIRAVVIAGCLLGACARTQAPAEDWPEVGEEPAPVEQPVQLEPTPRRRTGEIARAELLAGLELELVEAPPRVIAGGNWHSQWDIALASLNDLGFCAICNSCELRCCNLCWFNTRCWLRASGSLYRSNNGYG